MSEKLSERFAALFRVPSPYPNLAEQFSAVGHWAEQNYGSILSALRLSEQPPTDVAGMRESLQKLTDDVGAAWLLFDKGIRLAIGNKNYNVVKQRIVEADAVLRSLPPSPTADALQSAKEALKAALPWVESGPAGSWRDGTMAKVEHALAAIRKTKES